MSAATLAALALALCLTGCATGAPFDPDDVRPMRDDFDAMGTPVESHNAAGGYRDACGELPGLIGDDC